MPKKYAPIRGLSGISFLDDANFYLQNANYRNKLEKICEKYGIRPRLEPGPDHTLMWAEIGAALAEEHEGFGKRRRGRPKGKAGKPAQKGFMADEDIVRFFEWCANEWGCSFDDLLKKGVDWAAEEAEKIEFLEDPRANLKRLQRVKKQLDQQRLLDEQRKKLSTTSLGFLSRSFDTDKN
jgi:hypothetical protein